MVNDYLHPAFANATIKSRWFFRGNSKDEDYVSPGEDPDIPTKVFFKFGHDSLPAPGCSEGKPATPSLKVQELNYENARIAQEG